MGILVEDFFAYSFSKTLEIPPEDSYKLRDDYLNSDFFDKIQLIEGAEDGLKTLFDKHKIVFITSRPKNHLEKTKNFLKKYFPEENYSLIFSKTYDKDSSQIFDKDDYCIENGINVIVDDHNVLGYKYASKGLVVLLPDKPWNQELEHENIFRCKNWGEIVEKISEIENE